MELLQLELSDNEWPLEYIDHERNIARAIVYDDRGLLYFTRLVRQDEFGDGVFIETAGGGIEDGEAPVDAIRRELKEELGAEVAAEQEIAVICDCYNLIHRRNINHYFLCKLIALGKPHLTRQEQERFSISRSVLTPQEALREYEAHTDCALGRLLAAREVPVLQHALKLLSQR
ncbi:MAG: NUDIX hydrolase [Firmicutes bacterium]|nr:NUDIX hydrolase [Bacillota bacterium]